MPLSPYLEMFAECLNVLKWHLINNLLNVKDIANLNYHNFKFTRIK